MSAARNKMKIKKGDQVVVITGRDKGAKGEVTQVITAVRRVIVSGVNTVKKHEKPSQLNPQGRIKTIEKSIHVSNVALIDPKEDKPTRVGCKVEKDGKKVRVAKRSGEVITAE